MRSEYRIRFECAPGDIVASTALIRDLKLHYGDAIKLAYETNHQPLLSHNRHLEPVSANARVVTLDYKEGLRRSHAGTRMHFITWFHRYWFEQTNMPVQPVFFWPDLHLSKKLKERSPISGNYWLLFAGGKTDCTLKHWDFEWYNTVAAKLREEGVHCVQSGASGTGHVHPPVREAVLSLVGWGGLIELMWQIYHAQGIICPITCAMHMAAAFNKPCVVIAGGREEPWWEAYNNAYQQFGNASFIREGGDRFIHHKFLHTIGQLPCCQKAGCGRIHVRDANPDLACVARAQRKPGQQELPLCMAMIHPGDVVNAVMEYVDTLRLPRGGNYPQLLARDIKFHQK